MFCGFIGGIGDCWFMSALAVVAERHDLIAKLFHVEPTGTVAQTSNVIGAYSIRLFLDGEWVSVIVDDALPVSSNPRRDAIAVNFNNFAFCRCGSAESGGQQLWASILEKAYAKAHGSYQAISGGEVHEALINLTGAPSLSVTFDSSHFNSERLWRSLVRWRGDKLPMGSATAHDPLLKEVGICGGHAYR